MTLFGNGYFTVKHQQCLWIEDQIQVSDKLLKINPGLNLQRICDPMNSMVKLMLILIRNKHVLQHKKSLAPKMLPLKIFIKTRVYLT